jgi:dTDP-4-dehydrorhamnose reductase
MTKVAILGVTGMLGSVTLDSYMQSGEFEVIATYRNEEEVKPFKDKYPAVDFRLLDAEEQSVDAIAKAIEGADWVVNSIGIIKPYIHDDNAVEVERAIRVNGLFPHLLAKASKQVNAKVIQIATDCVYSGAKGAYVESDLHDAIDVYGKSKSVGEAYFDNIFHVRCSIIGPELKAHMSLMDWFLGNPKGATLNGFTNHQWNGVTTLQFAKLSQGIVKENIEFDHLQHIVPGNLITKANLLKCFAREFDREDITVNEVEAPKIIDRTVSTNNDELNKKIWNAAGYQTPPTIEEMVAELAEFIGAQKVNS